MSEAKHTPGPWVVAPYGNASLEIQGATDSVGRCYQVAIIKDHGDGPDFPIPIRANAKLIAAAPELLAALKRLEFAVIHGNGWQAWQDIKDQARAAITEATE